MFRSLFSVAAIFSLLFVSIASPVTAYGRRCPDEPPSTLLSLYKKSNAVYIGKFDKTTEGDVVRTDEESKTITVSEHFSISTTIKGESRKFFVRTYEQYRYNNVAVETEEFGEEYDEDGRSLEAGDNVILFLKYSEDEERDKKGKRVLDVAHYRDGIKQLDESELSSYEARIKELKGILSSKNVNDADVLNWILKCIDDPITRWEGAFELYSSFQTLVWKEESQKEDEEESADSDESENASKTEGADADAEAEEFEEEDEFDNSVYATLLTDAQKSRLTQVAISSKPAKANAETDRAELNEGDRVLFDVVKHWGDSRLAAAMLDRLRGTGDDNYKKLNWMSSIAEVLKDKELSAITEKFGDVTYQDDDEEFIESKDKPGSEVSDGPVAEPEKTDESEAETTEPAAEEKVPANSDDDSAKKTYKQHRDEMIADFIAKATAILSQEKKKAEAK